MEIDLPLDHPGGSHPAEGFEPRLALRLRRVLARLDPAAVVAHGGDAMKYVLPAVIGTGRPLVYCVIGTYAGRPSRLHEWRWRRIMASADLVVAVGDDVLGECTGRFRVPPQRVVAIPNGRDPSQYRPRSGPTSPAASMLIFVGALTPQKQPDRFVDVVGRLHAEGRIVHAQIAGDGPLADTLAPVAAAQGIELLGPRSDVPELLRRADVLVFTSLPTGEGMPGVLIEAGLSGLPAVSTAVPGAAAVICDGCSGMIVEDSVAAIASAVAQLLDDPDRRTAMGAAARSWCALGVHLGPHGPAVASRAATASGRSGANCSTGGTGTVGKRPPPCNAFGDATAPRHSAAGGGVGLGERTAPRERKAASPSPPG